MVLFRYLSSLFRRSKLDDGYPQHIQNWASRLQSRVSSNDLSDLKQKYEGIPLRRSSPKAKQAKKPKRRR
ncbi:MAG: hypothetical protein RL224_1029 [Actinomycetota bacterium]